ncbi:MAG: UvrD-helicase domain-containing protein, partial [Desulfovibrionaceae bacterium]|nr:UvrD-helicase domain-containing protein [Desulfovibrionaceae bacterium]
IPLPSILGQISSAAPQSKAVTALFRDALEHLGSEFTILAHLPIEQIAEYNPHLAEAVRRIRAGEIELHGGYDGEFGTISVFSSDELKEIAASAPRRGRGRRKADASAVSAPLSGLAAAGKSPDCSASDRESPTETAGGGEAKAVVRRKSRPAMQPGEAILAEKRRIEESRKCGEQAPAALVTLTEEQQAACDHEGSALIVIAGPGSGKTRLLTERLVRLLEKGVPPSSILALTFSRRAAGEMEERVRLRRTEGELPFCGTFHALAWKLFRRENPRAVLLTEQQSRLLLDRAIGETLPMTDAKTRRQYADRFWLMRERCQRGRSGGPEDRLARRYSSLKQEGGLQRMDFADLLEWLTAELRSGGQKLNPEQVLVDEIQDLSMLQLRLLAALMPKHGRGFFGIGDPDQAIYAFRGAVGDIVAECRHLWPGLEVVSLKTSFRSSQKILDAADGTMSGKKEHVRLTAARTLSAELNAYEAPTQGLEEGWVADQILKLLPATSHTLNDERKGEGGILAGALVPSDVAVLVRTRAQIPSLARALWKRGIPVQTPSMQLFWQEEGMDRVLAFMEERIARERAKYGLGPVAGMACSTVSPAELMPVLKEKGLADEALTASDAWRQLEKAYAQAGSWERLFEDICWQKEVDLLQTKAESVRLLTMHAAKGLEFRAVFLPGFNDGLLPHDRDRLAGRGESLTQEEMEEERRILYVALTRASQAVYVSWARERRLYGRELELGPSRFWPDLEKFFARRRLVRHVRRTLVQGSLV